jgi:lysosomal Pro-X carboxypeptidase
MYPSARMCFYLLVVIYIVPFPAAARLGIPPRPPFRHAARYGGSRLLGSCPRSQQLISQCEQRWRETPLDHFSFQPISQAATFKQRYFVCAKNWQPGGSVFFYAGNEADVTLYLNNTGLLWEMAPRHDAMLVFAEHRYYGQSKPFQGAGLYRNASTMAWLTTEQAMADYAELIFELKQELKDPRVPVIVAGGSYGTFFSKENRRDF